MLIASKLNPITRLLLAAVGIIGLSNRSSDLGVWVGIANTHPPTFMLGEHLESWNTSSTPLHYKNTHPSCMSPSYTANIDTLPV